MISLLRNALLVVLLGMQNMPPMQLIKQFIMTKTKINFIVCGSLSGGLWVLELDKTTGKPIYPGKDGTDSISNNYVDRYFGIHIAGGNHMSWEGGYIRYYKKSGYYFFYDTYRGGINM